MRHYIVLFLYSLIRVQLNPQIEGRKRTYSLNYNTFQDMVAKDNLNGWIVLFFSPNCVHCKNLMPLFYKIGYDLRQEGPRFGQVDCREEKKLCRMLRVNYYPKIQFFNNGLMTTFKEKRTEEEGEDHQHDGTNGQNSVLPYQF